MPPKQNPRKRKPENDSLGQSDTDKTAKRPRARAKAKATAMDQSDIQDVARNKEMEVMRIEADLDKHYLGSFRMSASALDFEWKGSNTTDQRRVSQEHVKKMLAHFSVSGLRRCAKEHHIAAIINKDVFFEAVQATIKTQGVDPLDRKYRSLKLVDDEPEDITPAAQNGGPVGKPRTDAEGLTPMDRSHHAEARFPYLVMPAGVIVEAQSGQHRIHALRQLFTEERDKWWVITLYDDRLSNTAKEKLRLNVTELHKPPTLAEIWQNLLVYKDQGDKSATDATLGTVKSASKVRQLLNFSQYRDPITQALRNRGVWPLFTGGRLSFFLPMRAIEENVRYLTRVNQIWDYIGEGIPNFYEAMDEASLKIVEGLAPARFAEDAIKVDQGMEGRLFFKITDKQQRSIIHTRLKSIDYRILTLNTFWDDIKSMGYISRVMSDACFWLSEEFAAASKKGTAYKHSLSLTFKAGFSPKRVYPRQRDYPQYIIKDNKLEAIGSRLPDGPYCACAYFQLWLFAIRNFFALHKALNPTPNYSQVEPLPWVGQGVVISDDMTDEQIENYNKRFSIPEWRMFWRFSRALGFFPEYAESIGIGPEHCDLPEIPVQDPEAMAHLQDMRRLSDAVRSLRPTLTEKHINALSTSFAEQLPNISEDELMAFGEVCPRTENIVQRVGGIEAVWLPDFHKCHIKIDWGLVSEMDGGVSIAEDAERTTLSWFIKRDFIWVFMRPFADGGPIFGPRVGSWPPISAEHGPTTEGQDVTIAVYDDDLLGAFRNVRQSAIEALGGEHEPGVEDEESECGETASLDDINETLPNINLDEDEESVSGEEIEYFEPAMVPASEGYYAEDEGVGVEATIRSNLPGVLNSPTQPVAGHASLAGIELPPLKSHRDFSTAPLPVNTPTECSAPEAPQSRLKQPSEPDKSLEDDLDAQLPKKRSGAQQSRVSPPIRIQKYPSLPSVDSGSNKALQATATTIEGESRASKLSEGEESLPPSKRTRRGSKVRSSKEEGKGASADTPKIKANLNRGGGKVVDKATQSPRTDPTPQEGAPIRKRAPKPPRIEPATAVGDSTQKRATRRIKMGATNPRSTLYETPPPHRTTKPKSKGKTTLADEDDDSDSVFAI